MLVYLLLRALYVPYIHDEAATFFHYIQKGEFMPGTAQWDANNHLLNSLISSVIYSWFGADVFLLRLPNVLAFILYFYAGWHLSLRIRTLWMRHALLTALLFSHGFMEFFALNRGYGMSMAFLLAAIVLAVKWTETPRIKWIAWYGLSGFLAVSANLTLLPVLYLLDVFLLLSPLILSVSQKRNHLILSALVLLVVKLPFVWFGFALSTRGALYYGGSDFFNLTVQCLETMMWGMYAWWTDTLLMTVSVIAMIVFVWRLRPMFRHRDVALLFPFLFFASLASIFAQHFILGINYPEDRTGMYLFPLLVLAFIFILDRFPLRWLQFTGLLAVALPVHFIIHANTSYVTIWQNQGMPDRFYQFVRSDYKGDRPFLAASQKLLGFSWTFHDQSYDPVLGPVQHNGYTDGLADYVIVIPRHLPDIDLSQYTVIDTEEASGNLLLKRKIPVPLTLLYDSSHTTPVTINGDEYYDVYNTVPDTLRGKTLAVEVSGTVTSFDEVLHAIMAWTGETDDNPLYYYEQYHLDWYRRYVHRFRVTFMFKKIPDNLKILKVYIFNARKQTYRIDDMHVKVFRVEEQTLNNR